MADDGVRVNRSLHIPRTELDVRFTTSGGPGGQHANKTATRVELRFDVESSAALSEAQRRRVLDRLGPVVRVVVDEERSQLRNRAIAEQRLARRLADALHVATPRRATAPTKTAVQKRLASKKRRSETKAGRRPPRSDD
ncbi:MAG TPA: alternative ribosome rescue aminoacyl-tRNA hydrolase ArfB [Ilumatobacteraceae bacterium]